MPDQTQSPAFLVRRRIHNRRKGNTYNIEPMLIYAETAEEAHEKLRRHFESISYVEMTESIYQDGSKSIMVGAKGVQTDETYHYSIVNPQETTQIS